MKYTYSTRGTCSSAITFDIDNNGIVTNIAFSGGCNGNLKAIAKLTDGKSAEYISSVLRGNTCGYKNTSCADQLAIAVSKAAEEIVK